MSKVSFIFYRSRCSVVGRYRLPRQWRRHWLQRGLELRKLWFPAPAERLDLFIEHMGTWKRGLHPFNLRLQLAALPISARVATASALHGKVCRSNRQNTFAHHLMPRFDAFYICLDDLNDVLQCMLMLCLCRSAVARRPVPDFPCFSSSSRVAFREAFASRFSCPFNAHTSYEHNWNNMRVVVSKFTSCVVKQWLMFWRGLCVLQFWGIWGLNASAVKHKHQSHVASCHRSIDVVFIARELHFLEGCMQGYASGHIFDGFHDNQRWTHQLNHESNRVARKMMLCCVSNGICGKM